ncbi:hypothetical protein LTR84_012753 [Exophiala bonariae]|uniref:UBC core domain-containing protein n=1 Tax=Exophiala bonariae TaxID=1690606 RepID=A0AAV9NEV8_9EURO|nr:hypothetical protein LTR84_012753 [Exophiala bonariae]
MFAAKRLGKELQKAKAKNFPPGIQLVQAEDFREWQVDIQVLDNNPIYRNQVYRLCFLFSESYPIEPPEVCFIHLSPAPSDPVKSPFQPQSASQPFAGRPIPIHPHIYTNGIICLDLLGSAGWSPVQSVESVCMSIQSMLTGNSKNERPQGDEQFCQSMGVRGPNGWSNWRNGGRGLKDVRFAYDDDTV